MATTAQAQTKEQRLILGVTPPVIALSLARFCDAFGNSIMFVVLPLYVYQFKSDSFGIPTEIVAGLLIALYPLFYSICQPFVGWLADKTGRYKLLIIIGLALVIVGMLGFIISRTIWELAFWRIIAGIGVALNVPTAIALISMNSRLGNRATSMSFFVSFRMLGFGSGPIVGGFSVVYLGYEWSFIIAAVLVGISLLLVQLIVEEAPSPALDKTKVAAQKFFQLARQKWIISLALGNIALGMAINFASPLEFIINLKLHQSAFEFGIAISLMTFASLLLQMPVGRFADNYGRTKIIVAGMILLAPSTALVGFISSTLMFYILMAVVGAAFAMIGSPSYALAGDLAPPGSVGRQISVLSTAFGLGLSIGPILAGVMNNFFGFATPFLLGGSLAALCIPLLITNLKETIEINRAD